MQIAPAASEARIVGAPMATADTVAEVLRKAVRFVLLLLGFALVIAAVVSLRFALYEYGHGNTALVRQVAGTLLSGFDQTSR
jgi:membrane-anchored glycerophosphoryl diester phosphodiesterase (GDPDase)